MIIFLHFWLFTILADVVIGHRDRLHCPSSESFSSELISGEFKSPGFPLRYINQLHCVYVIEPLEDWAVVLNIEFFQTENLHDIVEVHQTYNYKDELYTTKHAILSGIDISQTQFFSQVNGGFRIVFDSDFSEANFPGFKMSFKRFHPSGFSSPNVYPCPEVFHLANQTKINLPNFVWRYSPRNSCVFQINSTDSIELQLNSVKQHIKIDVYESDNFGAIGRASNPLGSYHGFLDQKFPSTLKSRTGSFIIIVSMMSNHANFSADAFNITYQQVNNPCSCPPNEVSLNYTTFEFNSPGWPGDYCDKLKCVTNFKVVDGLPTKPNQAQSIVVEFNSFKVEAIHDLFELYSGNKRLKLLTPYDEFNTNMIGYFTFPSNNAMINFTTDDTITAEGFNLGIKVIDRPSECGCPNSGDTTEIDGSLRFINSARCGYIDCFWNLIPPTEEDARYRIVMIVWFNVGSWSEFIEISGDHQIGPHLNTIRLTPSMIAENESIAGKFVSLHSEQLIQIWYHREDAYTSASPNRFFHIDYRWTKKYFMLHSNLALAKLAQIYLSVPSTSIESERLFSQAILAFASDLRDSLHSDKLEMMLVLKADLIRKGSADALDD